VINAIQRFYVLFFRVVIDTTDMFHYNCHYLSTSFYRDVNYDNNASGKRTTYAQEMQEQCITKNFVFFSVSAHFCVCEPKMVMDHLRQQ